MPILKPSVAEGRLLFRFAIIADTHLEPEPEASARSNRRTRHAIALINDCKPAFVIHLGDVVHPVPALESPYRAAAAATQRLFAEFRSPLYITPGNHDVGDKCVPWMPAGGVTEPWLDLYAEFFGRQFGSFTQDGCRFIFLNSPVLNSGLPIEQEQRQWLETECARGPGERLFLFTHYPPFITDAGEASHYDNIDSPAREWLLALVARHEAEALFAGHVHNVFYKRIGGTDFHALPSPSFARRDYSAMARVAPGPADEFGRNDAGKLGFFTVDVLEHGHIVRFVHTDGIEDAASAAQRPVPPHPKSRSPLAFGVHLRHAWAAAHELPFNGPTDEFQRRRARDDNVLWLLWEMGIRRLRVPLEDLADPQARERMVELAENGHLFTVFSVGIPDAAVRELMARHGHLAEVWEVAAPLAQAAELAHALLPVRGEAPCKILYTRLQTPADRREAGAQKRFVSHGFTLRETDALDRFLAVPRVRDAIDGAHFRVGLDEPVWTTLVRIGELVAARGVALAASACLGPDDPNLSNLDDSMIAARTAEAVAAGYCLAPAAVFIDTFQDIDRGYFVRNGLADQRSRPRAAGRVAANLLAHLAGAPTEADRPTPLPDRCGWTIGGMRQWIVTPGQPGAADPVWPSGAACVDLVTGDRLAAPPGPVASWHPLLISHR